MTLSESNSLEVSVRNACNEIDRLRELNAELLEALKLGCDVMMSISSKLTPAELQAYQIMHAAIDKAEESL